MMDYLKILTIGSIEYEELFLELNRSSFNLLIVNRLYICHSDLTETFPSVTIYLGNGIKTFPAECFCLPNAIEVAKWKLEKETW
jgi:hypothetical protein